MLFYYFFTRFQRISRVYRVPGDGAFLQNVCFFEFLKLRGGVSGDSPQSFRVSTFLCFHVLVFQSFRVLMMKCFFERLFFLFSEKGLILSKFY